MTGTKRSEFKVWLWRLFVECGCRFSEKLKIELILLCFFDFNKCNLCFFSKSIIWFVNKIRIGLWHGFLYVTKTMLRGETFSVIFLIHTLTFSFYTRNIQCIPLTISDQVYFLRVTKFGACYNTGQWGEFKIKNAALWFHILFWQFFVLFHHKICLFSFFCQSIKLLL